MLSVGSVGWVVACKGSDTQLYLVIDRADSRHGLSNECGMGNWGVHGSDEHQLRTATDCEGGRVCFGGSSGFKCQFVDTEGT